jgi:hypothetical protein
VTDSGERAGFIPVIDHMSDVLASMTPEQKRAHIAGLVSGADIAAFYNQSQADLPNTTRLVIDAPGEYRPLRPGQGLLKIGDQILRFQGNVNPLDHAISDDGA